MTKVLLAVIYPLAVVARALNMVMGRDPLRLSNRGAGSYWVPRAQPPGDAGYFAESSASEGRDHGGMGAFMAAVLAGVARLYAPPRAPSAERFSAAADREQGIPDEMYTLW